MLHLIEAAGAVVAALLAWWRVDVEVNPYKPCPRCGGTGRGPGSRKKAFNVCKNHQVRAVRFAARGAAARHDRRKGL